MADTYNWATPGNGTFNDAADWTDVTTPGSTGVTFPGSLDIANLIGPGSGSAQTIDGPGTVDVLNVSGLNQLTGSFASVVTRVDSLVAATLDLAGSLAASDSLVVGDSGGGAMSIGASSIVTAGTSSSGTGQVILGNASGASGTLTVGAGGTLDLAGPSETSNYGFFVGDSGSGALVVTGADATVDDIGKDGVVVGDTTGSSGSVLVENGATASFGSTNSDSLSAIAIGRIGNGTFVVDGSGSQVTADGGLYVGRSGAGGLTISDNGVVTQTAGTAYVQIGYGSDTTNSHVGGTGSATVESDGKLADNGDLRVGGYGVSGSLVVETGGSVTATTTAGTTGIVVGNAGSVDGVFEGGSGTLAVEAGSTVSALGAAAPGVAGLSIGSAAGAVGTVDVNGIGALINTGSNLVTVANSGTGTLNVTGGGTIMASSPGTGYAALVVGSAASGMGTMTVSGDGSTVTANGALTVGFQGHGTMSIGSGGGVTAQLVLIGDSAGSTGAISVSGASSTLSSTGAISIGPGGNGTLALAGGQVAAAGGVQVGSTGTVTGNGTIAGGIVSTGVVIATGGTLSLSNVIGGTGAYDIAATGELVLAGGASSETTLTFSGVGGVLDVSNPGPFTGTVDGFGFGDTILAQGAASIGLSGTTLTLFNSGSGEIGAIALSSVLSVGSIVDADGVITYACFAAGTRLATTAGEVAVEALAVGDRVVTASGVAAEVRWIGHRRVACARQARPEEVWPVRIRAGAFGAGLPARDLWLSPDHAVFVRGVLIPVRYLVNGRSIAQEPRAEVTYFHVELARHDIVLAEGLACESYLDTGNRAAFANGGPAAQMQPDFSRGVWEAEGCAPLVLDGPEVVAARRRLLRRAAALGYRLTRDPGLRVLADGHALRAVREGQRWRVHLPEGARIVRLGSRAWVPAQTRPDENDTRRLGVAIARLWLDGREVALDSPGLTDGWHAAEPAWRWTDGDAALAVAGARDLAFAVALTGTYRRDAEPRSARAA